MPTAKRVAQTPNRAQRVQKKTEDAPRQSTQATGTATVTVGCKLPNGFLMRAFAPKVVQFPIVGMPGQFRDETINRPTGGSFRIAGAATAPGTAPRALIVDGAALTSGVPRELAETWFRQNAKSDLVTSGAVFMRDDELSARDQARDHRGQLTGLEPLDPNVDSVSQNGRIVQKPRDYRWPRKVRPEMTVVASDARE